MNSDIVRLGILRETNGCNVCPALQQSLGYSMHAAHNTPIA
jgi:hypothetical protein